MYFETNPCIKLRKEKKIMQYIDKYLRIMGHIYISINVSRAFYILYGKI